MKIANVLSIGFQLAFLVAVPKWFYTRSSTPGSISTINTMRDMLMCRPTPGSSTIVCQEFQSLDDFKLNKPKLLNFPFQCTEGDYDPCWGSWSTKDMEKADEHKQFQKYISNRIVSVMDWLAWVDDQEDIVYGHAMRMMNL